MKYRHWDAKLGRVYVAANPWALNLPRITACVDGECVVLAASYGNGISDPVILVDLTLTGTRAARWVAAAYWFLRERWERR